MVMKIVVFWDMTPCSLVEFADVSEDIFAYVIKVRDGGSRILWNITFKEQSLSNKNFGRLLFQRCS